VENKHAHRKFEQVPDRIRGFREAAPDDQLMAIAELHRRVAAQSPSAWLNGLLAFVPILVLFGTMLLAAYGIMAQGGIAYWTLFAQQGDSQGISPQSDRWGKAITSIVDDPNALSSGLSAWAWGLVAVLISALALGVSMSIYSSSVRAIATAWIVIYERVLSEQELVQASRSRMSRHWPWKRHRR
jgi:hypothetical protein